METLDVFIDEFLCYCDGAHWVTDVKHIRGENPSLWAEERSAVHGNA